jgi:HK97 family phage major capsid protein
MQNVLDTDTPLPELRKRALRQTPLRALTADQAYKAGKFFKSIVVSKAQGEGVNSSGGYLVPWELLRTLISLRELAGTFRSASNVVVMASDTAIIPRRTSGLTASFFGEAAEITATQQLAWDAVSLTAKKLGVIVRSSDELTEDNLMSVGDQIVSEMAYGFAVKEDACGWNGDGTSTFGGMVGICPTVLDGNHAGAKISATAGHDLFSEIDATDLSTLLAALPSYAQQGAAWFCSSTALALVFCRLSGGGGGVTIMTVNGRSLPSFWGMPIYLTPALPTVQTTLINQVMLALGRLDLACTFGSRRDVTIKTTPNRYIEFGQIGWRGIERFDIVCNDLGSSAPQSSPLVCLVGA